MNKKQILSLFILIGSLSLTGCNKDVFPTTASFSLTDLTSPVSVHSQIQLEKFIDNDSLLTDTMLNYLNGLNYRTDYSLPEAIKLSWDVEVDQGSFSSYMVDISENIDMSDAYRLTTNKKEVEFYNAKVNTTYYWRVSSMNFVSDISSFTTVNKAPRNIKIDGIKNIRDIGATGKIKQGILYRGEAFESYDKNSDKVIVNITNEGKNIVKNQLKIKTEVDLRRTDNKENCSLTKSTVDGLSYKAIPLYYGGNNILTYEGNGYNNPEEIKSFFELLKDNNNFPMYFHCAQGKDRTGCLAYLLNALMGDTEENLYRDYLFSNMANASYSMKTNGIDGYFGKTISRYKDESYSLSEKTRAYLEEVIGLSSGDIDQIIDNIKA